MDTAFTNRQRETLAAAVDTFVPSVSRDDDPDGFFATKGSDVGAHVAVEHYLLSRLTAEQLAGLQQLLDTAGLIGLKNQSQAVREAIIGNLGRIAPESHGAIAALKQLSVMFSYGLPDATGRNPFWQRMLRLPTTPCARARCMRSAAPRSASASGWRRSRSAARC